MENTIVFALSSSKELANQVCEILGRNLAKSQ